MTYFIRLWVGCFRIYTFFLTFAARHVWVFKVQYILFNWNGRIAIGLEINSEVYMCWELVKLSLKQSGAKQSLCWMLELRYDITWYHLVEALCKTSRKGTKEISIKIKYMEELNP
jgi:hypothetical protein